MKRSVKGKGKEPLASASLYDVERDGVTQGMLAQFVECRQSCAYRTQGWHTPAKPDALFFGSMMHAWLEQRYSKGAQGVAEFFTDQRRTALKNGLDGQAVEDVIGQVSALVLGYIKHWQKTDCKKRWVALERVFDVMWGGVRLRGKVDGLYKDAKGQHWLFETKTKTYVDAEEIGLALQFDFQSLFYAEAMELALDLKPGAIVGVQYNVIRKPALRIGKDGDRADWFKRIREDIETRPEWYYVRAEARWSPRQREAFVAELGAKLDVFKRWCAGDEDEPTFRNQGACVGKWQCRYLRACATGLMEGYERDEAFRYRELEEGAE